MDLCPTGSIENGEAVIRGDQNNGGGGGGGNNDGGGNEDGGTGDGGNADGSDGPGGIDRDLTCTSGALCLPELVTLSDLARFRPNAPTLTMEPDGWLLIGFPANFIADTNRHVQQGSLFDVPIEVRFTPDGYNWSWGDGTSSRTTVPGATWAELGLPEFSATPTSHVFASTGVYSITVTVAFTVEYRAVGGSWIGIAGTLSAPAVTVAALAGDAKTVLVDKECNRNPSGPGC
ncbi:hypothetical protein L1277_000506 [Okibacterium sp. HSC-33S16]|uniref:hypothetical protein n=1 Tax=Okibacterium sp. HSC-33S16 TaxID=2910965 RepID=UPI00209D6C9B|nr:hypothetical protein [Okibacterium sp. HSC-33S16]MCP2030442.1 hypothetical protein [Okibacterium sp. HSC-33S16]